MQTRSGESGWVYSKHKRPTGTEAFYFSLGVGGVRGGGGGLPLTGCCNPRNQFNTNEGCSWEQRSKWEFTDDVAQLSEATMEVQEMAAHVCPLPL